MHTDRAGTDAPQPAETEGARPVGMRIERDGAAALVAFDPAAANAPGLCGELIAALRRIEEDGAVDAVVMMVGPASAACAGDGRWPALSDAIGQCAKPIIAAIDGAIPDAAFELALACDARVAVAGAVIALPQPASGRMPGAVAARRLPQLVGTAAAIGIICSGRSIGAMEAVGLGLIDAVVGGDLRAGATDYALACAKAGRKRHAGELPAGRDTPEQVEQAAREALRASGGQADVAAAIDAMVDAARGARHGER